jgi:hypothetical protein
MPTRRKAPEWAPWLPVPYEIADVAALQALARGEASAEQQRRALIWITESAAGVYLETFHPDDARWSDFAQGRRFVGLSITKLCRLNVQELINRERRKRGLPPEASEQPA